MLKTEHIKIRVTKFERQLIEESTQITISNALRSLINQLKERNNNELE